MKKPEESWIVYILECKDGTLYTGITKNLEKRIHDHESGKGAKYTKGRSPFKVFYIETHPNRSSASKRELQVKSLDKITKMQLKQANASTKK